MTMLIDEAEKLDKIQHSFMITKKKKKKKPPSKLEIERNLPYCIKNIHKIKPMLSSGADNWREVEALTEQTLDMPSPYKISFA